MSRLRLRAFAKINLGLSILGARSDGYHELRTVFQTISLADDLIVERRSGRGVGIEVAAPPRGSSAIFDAPGGASNLAYRAAELARDVLELPGHVHITLTKRIPVRSGLGGGSSDGAAVLAGLARIAGQPTYSPRLLELAAQLGTDVPAFLVGGTVVGLGRGDEVYPLPDLPAWDCVVALAGTPISTPDAYRLWDEATHSALRAGSTSSPRAQPPTAGRQSPAPALTHSLAFDTINTFCSRLLQLLDAPPERMRGQSPPASRRSRDRGARSARRFSQAPNVRAGIENDFEAVVFPLSPDFSRLREQLIAAGAVRVSLTGSGAAQFGLFATREQARRAAAMIQPSAPAWPVRFVSRRQYRRQYEVPAGV